jgi:hypothetical protein
VDEDDDLVGNSLAALAVMAANPDEWLLYAQDDIEVAPDLSQQWDMLLAHAPRDATALALFQRSPRAEVSRPSWEPLLEDRLLWVQAVLLRTAMLPEMIRFITDETALAPVALRRCGFDDRLTRFVRAHGRAYTHVPSLVQHMDLPSVSGKAVVPGYPRTSGTFDPARRVADLYGRPAGEPP